MTTNPPLRTEIRDIPEWQTLYAQYEQTLAEMRELETRARQISRKMDAIVASNEQDDLTYCTDCGKEVKNKHAWYLDVSFAGVLPYCPQCHNRTRHKRARWIKYTDLMR